MFKNAKVGDKVWHIQEGWCKIYKIDDTHAYPIKIKSDRTNNAYSFDFNGLNIDTDINPTLFWNEFKIPEEAFVEPLPQLEIDTKVIVWNEPGWEEKRHFSHFKDGKIYCFSNGASSWNATDNSSCWDNWEIYDESKDKKN